jgi:hypothetical protein
MKWLKSKVRLPTDLQILDAIYERYYHEFEQGGRDDPDAVAQHGASNLRESTIYVPIDIQQVSDDLKVDANIVFGRLYYYLEQRYRYRQENDAQVSLFARAVGKSRNAVNFPYMASVLAGLREEHKKYKAATWMSGISLVLSVIAIVVSAIK